MRDVRAAWRCARVADGYSVCWRPLLSNWLPQPNRNREICFGSWSNACEFSRQPSGQDGTRDSSIASAGSLPVTSSSSGSHAPHRSRHSKRKTLLRLASCLNCRRTLVRAQLCQHGRVASPMKRPMIRCGSSFPVKSSTETETVLRCLHPNEPRTVFVEAA